jgi:hypothetical protein
VAATAGGSLTAPTDICRDAGVDEATASLIVNVTVRTRREGRVRRVDVQDGRRAVW